MLQARWWTSGSRKWCLPWFAVLPWGARFHPLCLPRGPEWPPQPDHAVSSTSGRHKPELYESELPDLILHLILHENSSSSLSRLTPPLLWKASPLSPTASPTTLQAQGTPSPFSQACIQGGSEIHSPLLTFNPQPVVPVSS